MRFRESKWFRLLGKMRNKPRRRRWLNSFAPDPRAEPSETPASFPNGRYQVKRFLGKGGKKKVYLATDTLLDRDVAWAFDR